MRSDDGGREVAFMRALSNRSRRLRFLSHMKELPPRLLHRFTHPDPARETVLVVVDPERDAFVGVGRHFILNQGDCCEFAIATADAWQREGIGRYLMERLIDDARDRGLRGIEGLVLCENLGMQRLMLDLGFDIRRNRDDPTTWHVSKTLP